MGKARCSQGKPGIGAGRRVAREPIAIRNAVEGVESSTPYIDQDLAVGITHLGHGDSERRLNFSKLVDGELPGRAWRCGHIGSVGFLAIHLRHASWFADDRIPGESIERLAEVGPLMA